ncbi:host specificity protein [Meridianimarinicoccus roseus]|uniref:Host specificity protein n=1 Tax=Meridianimarinicoccus roseus TaxID=2072018 RepID=A0A2V2LDA4_9RHOB|nr:glycoside hydrolase/phage tail family protein [Meridianimarinicoccus roseus]PWR03042.1 host specificity protein [Meridianimarinicoccus roseus]
MATLVLSAAGAAAGGAIGGSFLGLSAAVIGRAVGATAGQLIDQRLMGAGSDVIERGRVDRFRLTGASEGTALPQIFGRMRVGGHVIWATQFSEQSTTQRASGGKGGSGGPSVTSYSYSVSLAIALCEGQISHVARVWADGQELDRGSLAMRVYPGTETQVPDPKIAAVEGAEHAPAYRGTAYLVLDDLDLTPYGNRVPQFTFEVVRPEQPAAQDSARSMVDGIQAVALIPGTGEYSLATTPVHYAEGPGRNTSANRHNSLAPTDFLASLDALQAELPNCRSISLVVSWFGDDLRCGSARIRPKVEHKFADGAPLPWSVAGVDRVAAQEVPRLDGAPVYGGTPTDASVIEAIRNINARGKTVMFYPFILMEQMPGNTLPDPWTGAIGQPELPWRGRITTSVAPGLPGSSDGTAAAAAEVAAFFGTVRASDFVVGDGTVTYSGPDEWSLRRFILHNAALCKAAGGVDSFCIGSEMRALTQIRGPGNSFPAVQALIALAGEVRALLGPSVKLGYAADWSEYFGYTPTDGSGDHFFHLDPLWAHPEIDFIGIDNYMRISDWRDGEAHADALAGSIYDLDYLRSNVAGGEGYDWYYPDAQAAEAQLRAPITDGDYGEPWVFRYKDLVSWWSLPHHDRIAGVRLGAPTAWEPGSKPVWFTELGCAAIDKGTNQPNKFLDPKSSESLLPRASNGTRDDLIQMQYLRASFAHWADPANNPVSSVYGGPMVDMTRAHVWAWDARPYPWFPGLSEVWNDGPNYIRGHWLNGRVGAQLLSSVVREICQRAGLSDPDVSGLHGLVRGYAIGEAGSARQALEPLMLAYGFDVHERDGRLVFRNRDGRVAAQLSSDDLARHPEQPGDLERSRAAAAETADRVQLNYIGADGGFEVRAIETALPGAAALSSAQSELNLVLTAAEARAVTERWLAEARAARDTARFALPPSRIDIGAGDVIELTADGAGGRYRVDRSDRQGLQIIEAVRVEPAIYRPGTAIEEIPRIRTARAPVPPSAFFMDLPLLRGDAVPHAPYIAVAARPWTGPVAVYGSGADANYRLNTVVEGGASVGLTRSPMARAAPGLPDRGAPLRVEMSDGALSSVPRDALLNGANVMAIGDGGAGGWEIFQFQQADLVAPDTYELSMRLRGQLGTDGDMPDVWPEGSLVVLLTTAVQQIDLSSSERGLSRFYRVGPADVPLSAPSFLPFEKVFVGNGLRPYSPVHLSVAKQPDGSHVLNWVRRTRIDGDIWSLVDVPLGETSEGYVLRILKDGTVRREEIVGPPPWRYPAALRAADGIAGGYEAEIAQISDRYGAGHFGRISIND